MGQVLIRYLLTYALHITLYRWKRTSHNHNQSHEATKTRDDVNNLTLHGLVLQFVPVHCVPMVAVLTVCNVTVVPTLCEENV